MTKEVFIKSNGLIKKVKLLENVIGVSPITKFNASGVTNITVNKDNIIISDVKEEFKEMMLSFQYNSYTKEQIIDLLYVAVEIM